MLLAIPITSLHQVQKVIDTTVRMIHGLRKCQSIQSIVIEEGWLSAESLIKLRTLLLLFTVFKAVNLSIFTDSSKVINQHAIFVRTARCFCPFLIPDFTALTVPSAYVRRGSGTHFP